MARKKAQMEWGGYLNVRLNQEQLKAFEVWRKELGDDVWELFLDLLKNGMKFSLVYDSDIDTYTCSLMNSSRCTCGLNSLYALTGFAPSWYEAIAVVIFKHHQILGGTWENYSPSKPIQNRLG